MSSSFLEAVDDRGVATLTLNRPDRHNAFDDALIADLTAALRRLGGDPGVRAVVLASTGRSFSAGADLGPGPTSGGCAGWRGTPSRPTWPTPPGWRG